jgi:hypothetical protein
LSKGKLKCFILMIGGGYYRPDGRILTVHATSLMHAAKLLKKSGKVIINDRIYFSENHHCDPQSGQLCYYHLLVQPGYGITPEIDIQPNSPEWHERVSRRENFRKNKLSPERKRIFDAMRRKRKDLYD